MPIKTKNLQYLVDEKGNKKSVVISYEEFKSISNKLTQLEQQPKIEQNDSSNDTEVINTDFLEHLLIQLKKYQIIKSESGRKNLIQKVFKEIKHKVKPIEEEQVEQELLHNVPELDKYFLQDLVFSKQIETNILAASISNKKRSPLLFHAPSGIGKSSQLIAITKSSKMQKTFLNGIFWFRFGIYVDILSYQLYLIKSLGGKISNIFNVETAKESLAEIVKNKRCLVILDDICDPQDVLPFYVPGKDYQLLITTSEDNVLDVLQYFIENVQINSINPLSETQAIEFFLNKLALPDITRNSLPIEAEELVEACKYSPSTLDFLATTVRSDLTGLKDTLERILNPDYELLEKYPSTLIQALYINVESLGEEGDYYLALAVFGSYIHIPQFVVSMLWNYLYQFNENKTTIFINRLADRNLLKIIKEPTGNYLSLHTFQYEYIIEESDLEILHNHLLATYRLQCGQHGWIGGPNDGYFFENLCLHLHNADRSHELRALLLNFDWIQNKLKATNIYALLNDYEWLEGEEVEAVKNALHFSALPLTINTDVLAEQLLNNLWEKRSNKDIQALLNQAHAIIPNWEWKPEFPNALETLNK
ncbi:MAG: hypothetical protein KAH84_02370 [Thiomargarita sp.]|nr:hypothetical protein [Thiomargarita sp.]